jgi:hypothetical protein
VISSDLIHNHPEEENIERQALSNGVKRKALDNLTHKPAKLLRQELRQNGFLDQIFTYDVDRARKNLWQARRSVQLPLPKTQLEGNNSISWLDFVMLLKVGRSRLQGFNARAQLGHTDVFRSLHNSRPLITNMPQI